MMLPNLFKLPGKFLLLAAAVLILLPFGAEATTIVAARSATEIVIGADSKVTDTFGNRVAARACKIVQAGNVFFAYAGFARDAKTNFSVPQIAADALKIKPNTSLSEKTSLLANYITAKLSVELPYLKKNEWNTYREKIEGKIFLRILVAGFERGKPALFVRQFRVAQINPNKIDVVVSSDDCGAKNCKGNVVTRFLGEIDAIDGLPEETPGFWKNGLISGVKSLVETEIAARDEYVGAPVDILRITAKGAQWIQKKPECPEIQNYLKSPPKSPRRIKQKR